MKKENLLYHTVFIIRILVLLLTIFLVYNGWGVYSGTKESALLMYANMTAFGFWLIFMMGSIVISPLGRFFCAICPAGETNYQFSKFGFKMPVNLKYSFLQGGSLIAVFMLVIVLHFSKHPHLTSLLILSVISLAALMGLLFKGNSFCLLLCPANAYLRFYARLSAFKIACKEKNTSSPCMVMLNPCSVKKEFCHLCFRCFKGADGLYITKDRKPAERIVLDFTNAELFIFSILSGLTIMAFIRVVSQVREVFVYPPYLISQYFGLSEEYIMLLLVIFGVFLYPAIFYSIFVISIKAVKKESFWNIAKNYLPFFMPLVLSIHLILALTKLNARIGFLPFVLTDPAGFDMVKLYSLSKIEIPADLIDIRYFKYVILALPLLALLLTSILVKKHVRRASEKFVVFTTQLIFFLFIEYCVISWLFKGVFR